MKKTQVTIQLEDTMVAERFLAIPPISRGELVGVLLQAFFHQDSPLEVLPGLTGEQWRTIAYEEERNPLLAIWAEGEQACVIFVSGERWKIDAEGQQTEIYAPTWK